MNVPLLGEVDVSDWVRGVVGGLIGGGAGAISSGGSAMLFIDPAYIAAHGVGFIFRMMGGTFILSGVMSAALFLAKNPLPIKLTERTVESKQVGGKPAVVTETVKETTVSTEPPVKN